MELLDVLELLVEVELLDVLELELLVEFDVELEDVLLLELDVELLDVLDDDVLELDVELEEVELLVDVLVEVLVDVLLELDGVGGVPPQEDRIMAAMIAADAAPETILKLVFFNRILISPFRFKALEKFYLPTTSHITISLYPPPIKKVNVIFHKLRHFYLSFLIKIVFRSFVVLGLPVSLLISQFKSHPKASFFAGLTDKIFLQFPFL